MPQEKSPGAMKKEKLGNSCAALCRTFLKQEYLSMKLYQRTIIDKETGEKTRIYRDATPEEEAEINSAKQKEAEYIKKFSEMPADEFSKYFSEKEAEHAAAYNKAQNLGSELEYLRYISKKIKEMNGERVEWMGG
ncbi:hypothetical protein [Aeromonas veronii]|nr:hypothetical protein [Aeromonas veronii]